MVGAALGSAISGIGGALGGAGGQIASGIGSVAGSLIDAATRGSGTPAASGHTTTTGTANLANSPALGSLLASLGSAGVTGGSAGGSSKAQGQADVLTPMVTTLTGHLLGQSAGKGAAPDLTQKQSAALTGLANKQAAQPLLDHSEKVGRAEVNRVKSALVPQLDDIKRRLRERATQIAATAEHKNLVAKQAYRDQVRASLARIEARIDRAVQPRRY